MSRPIGYGGTSDVVAFTRSIHLQARTPASFGGAKDIVARVRLTATDEDVSIGNGPEVSGSAVSLLLAMTGRTVSLDELDGPGAAALAAVR